MSWHPEPYAFRVEEDGKHLVKRPGRGGNLELPTALLAEEVAQAICRAHQHGRVGVQDAIKDALGIREREVRDN